MPRKKQAAQAADTSPDAAIPDALLKHFVPGPMSPEGLDLAFRRFKKAFIEAALGAEMGVHLGTEEGAIRADGASNHRNGTSGKTLLTDDGQVRIDVPRDRAGTFQPQLVPKHERRLEGFDDRIVSMYARGMTVREIQGHLSQMYALEVSPEFISKVTDAVMGEVVAWQSRPLEPMYPVVFLDALRVKVREDALVRNKAVYLALGVQADGTRDVLGLWIEDTEGAKFWMKVFNDLRTRGVDDILVAVADGLTGLPGALEAVFPRTTLQTCVVHLIRNSLGYASWKDRKALAAALRPIYTAATAEEAEVRLAELEAGPWGKRHPPVAAMWRRAWVHVIPFLSFPPEVRRVIYTTNAIESVNSGLRKAVRARGHFPSDQAATKLIWLALRNITAKWRRATRQWKEAMNQFAILYEGRFTTAVQ